MLTLKLQALTSMSGFNVHYVVNDANTDQVWGDQEKINEKKFKLVYELIGLQGQ